MKTKSGKAKGRRLQDETRDLLRSRIYSNPKYCLCEDDVKSQPMGQKGPDIILSPAARKVLDLTIECKNQERLNVPQVFKVHYDKYKNSGSLKLLVHSKNRHDNLVTMRLTDLIDLMATYSLKEENQISACVSSSSEEKHGKC